MRNAKLYFNRVCINFFPFSDDARQSVVILMGSLAKHLDPSDPKVRPIMRQLILALNTPSQQVQEAVANCLPPLVPTIKEEAPEIVNNLIATLLGKKLFFSVKSQCVVLGFVHLTNLY